jgi:hypothetical protein
MKRSHAITAVLLCTMLTAGWVSLGVTGESPEAVVMPFEGHVKAMTIDLCGLQRGRCEGAMLLAKKEGGEVSLGITPGIRIRRGQEPVTIDEVEVGDRVSGQAIHWPGEPAPRIMRLEVTTP